MRLVDSKQMQAMDRYTIENIGIPSMVLMENAARSWVEAALAFFPPACAVFVFCGSGNNGGDGYAIARNLANRGFDCTVIAVKPPKSTDCIKNAEIWVNYGAIIAWDRFLECDLPIRSNDIVIDAVLGTGIESPIKGSLLAALDIIDKLKGFKIAVDLPSGISASTGDKLGVAIRNDVTITFQKEKVGHHLYPGKLYAGKVICQPITIVERYQEADAEYCLITRQMAQSLLPVRRPDSYKNQYGHLFTWCGTPGTLGASFLASFAALKVGTGLTTAALPESALNAFLAKAPELMTCSQETITLDFLKSFDAVVLGCGLGRESGKWNKIQTILAGSDLPFVIDADAFYGLKHWNEIDLSKKVLTPHPGEFCQISGLPKPVDNLERIKQGLDFVARHPTTLVLKGAPTIVFTAQGTIYLNSSGNSGMSTAGSGDVLSGIIGGLLAQGLSPESSALLGVWLHGKSGDLFVSAFCEEALTAMSLIDFIGPAIASLRDNP